MIFMVLSTIYCNIHNADTWILLIHHSTFVLNPKLFSNVGKIQQVSSKIIHDEEHKFPWCSEATNSNISVTKVINLVG